MLGKIKTAVAIALLAGVSVAAQAAGLGKLTVTSALGQVLAAEIDLVSLQPGELDSLTARVASPESYRDARIEYSSVLRLLRFSVEKRASGQPYIKLTSVAPINEPFVDVLIEVTWPAGRLQREYPILLGAMPRGPKMQAGDLRTPEGVYTLDWRNPKSRFYKAMHISYPSPSDRERAQEKGVDPGGMVMIHGEHYEPAMRRVLRRNPKDWTEGCIALNNEHIDELWHTVPVGTPIEIKP